MSLSLLRLIASLNIEMLRECLEVDDAELLSQ